ncbi:hypothetical protein J2755_000535 [Methanohalophilus levihalophilus]|nr:hypothetical protein [Methanohalophilus levihalophilus]
MDTKPIKKMILGTQIILLGGFMIVDPSTD